MRDLDIPCACAVCPTVRERDGLAISSRNAYLTPTERARALALSRALRAAEAPVAAGATDAGDVLAAARAELDARRRRARVPGASLRRGPFPVERVNGSTLLAVAARVGRARLIDNTILRGAA